MKKLLSGQMLVPGALQMKLGVCTVVTEPCP